MTGDEIIALARAQFGEPSANTVTTTTEVDFLNQSMKELYNDLPPERMKDQIQEASVTMTDNRGPVMGTWDRVVEVYVDDKPAAAVPRDVVQNASYGTMFTPPVPVFHIDDSYVWVAPSGAVDVAFLEPPAEVTNTALEITEFNEVWHPALASLITSYMYAQEEDQTQASHYRAEYAQMVANMTEQLAATEES